jgi:hypothetical protein
VVDSTGITGDKQEEPIVKITEQDIETLAKFKGIEAMFYFRGTQKVSIPRIRRNGQVYRDTGVERIDACAFEAPKGHHFSSDRGSDNVGVAGLGSQNIATLKSSHTVYRKRGRSTVSEFYKDMYQLLLDIKPIQCSADNPCPCWEGNGCVYWIASKEGK